MFEKMFYFLKVIPYTVKAGNAFLQVSSDGVLDVAFQNRPNHFIPHRQKRLLVMLQPLAHLPLARLPSYFEVLLHHPGYPFVCGP